MTKEMFVSISDFQLYAKRVGQNNGKPTVVMDAGYGDSSEVWDSVIRDISMLSTVLLYDRAGLGKSGASSNPRTSREMIKELKELLLKTESKPPYIVVGHSFGGVNMRRFATEYHIDVCGLVLIDSTPEDYREDFFLRCHKIFTKYTTSHLFMKEIIMRLWKV
jgi:pimeloyl-ACP methyl ester carboxylesterase